MSAADADGPRPADATPRGDIYEWEILIEAPFAFDFFKLVGAIFRSPRYFRQEAQVQPKSRRRYYLEFVLYNLGLVCLILLSIPFLMLAFSYVATLPFLLLRAGIAAVGAKVMAVLSLLGLIATLTVPVVLFLLMLRPTAYRDAYKRSKIELFNISIAFSLFLASGMLESLIASPLLPLAGSFDGPVDSTLQWTLFFADKAMNVLFANLPNKIFGPLSEISDGSPIALGLLRTLLFFGFVVWVRLLALKLCFGKTELFYGSVGELKAYLDYCGRAEAKAVRKVIDLPEDEMFVVRNRFRPGRDLPEPTSTEPSTPELVEVKST